MDKLIQKRRKKFLETSSLVGLGITAQLMAMWEHMRGTSIGERSFDFAALIKNSTLFRDKLIDILNNAENLKKATFLHDFLKQMSEIKKEGQFIVPPDIREQFLKQIDKTFEAAKTRIEGKKTSLLPQSSTDMNIKIVNRDEVEKFLTQSRTIRLNVEYGGSKISAASMRSTENADVQLSRAERSYDTYTDYKTTVEISRQPRSKVSVDTKNLEDIVKRMLGELVSRNGQDQKITLVNKFEVDGELLADVIKEVQLRNEFRSTGDIPYGGQFTI